ncbi:GlsB/YeaQ/YmgE family stress response membrane protein [Streptococcus hongkongensis]|nr:membrane protein [Streptococcus uberis]
MALLWTLIVGGLIGLIAGALTKHGGSMGWIANIVAGLVGAWVGQSLLGAWGPSLAGMALIPSIIGAVIVVLVTSFILRKMN